MKFYPTDDAATTNDIGQIEYADKPDDVYSLMPAEMTTMLKFMRLGLQVGEHVDIDSHNLIAGLVGKLADRGWLAVNADFTTAALTDAGAESLAPAGYGQPDPMPVATPDPVLIEGEPAPPLDLPAGDDKPTKALQAAQAASKPDATPKIIRGKQKTRVWLAAEVVARVGLESILTTGILPEHIAAVDKAFGAPSTASSKGALNMAVVSLVAYRDAGGASLDVM
jgi:hypothetical protein